MPTDPAKDLSIVIASFSGVDALTQCLKSLVPQSCEMQIIVATSMGRESCEPLVKCFPQVQWVYAPSESNVFRLRSLGLEMARRRVVALTEDHFTLSPEWATAIVYAAKGNAFILGGPIENGLTQHAFDWALYLVEYSAFMPPMQDGPIGHVSAANVAYPRESLQPYKSIWKQEFHDPAVHAALNQLDCHCQMVSRAKVKSHLGFSLRFAMAHLFAGGLWFGSYRVANARWTHRFIWSFSVPLIPILLMGRIVRRVLSKRPIQLFALIRCSVYIFILVMSWSVGEALGYWRALLGPPSFVV